MNISKTTLTERPSFLKYYHFAQTKVITSKRQGIVNNSRQMLLTNSSCGQFLKKVNALILGAFYLLRRKTSKNRLISFHCPQLGLTSIFFLISFLNIPNHLYAIDPCSSIDSLFINDCNGFDTMTVALNGVGPTSFALNGSCTTPNTNVAWVKFTMDATSDVMQWEMPDTNISYELYYSSSTCTSLTFIECDDEFIGFKQIAHPTPGTSVDLYLAISEDAGMNVTSVDIALEACICNLSITSNVASPVCEGTPYTLFSDTISGTAPFSYFWTDSLGFTTNSPTPTTGTGAGVGTYTYYMYALDGKGCSINSSIMVDVIAMPELVGRDTTICLGETVDLSALITQTAFGDSLEYGTAYGNYNLNDSLITPTTAGTFAYFLRDSLGVGGCVDTAVVNITVTALPNITGRDTSICAGQTLDLSILITQIQAGDSLEVGTSFGNYLISPIVMPSIGTTTYYLRDSIGAAGCVDTAQITLTVNQPEILGRDTTICIGESIDLANLVTRISIGDSLEFGAAYGSYPLVSSIVTPATSTTYFIRDSLGVIGCLDTTIVNVLVNSTKTTTLSETICIGDTYNFNGQILDTTGNYQDTLPIANSGCDSIIILQLNVLDETESTIQQEICQGASFTFNGQSLTNSGTYRDTIISMTGCSSIVELVLTVNPKPTISVSNRICSSNFATYTVNLTATGGSVSSTAGTVTNTSGNSYSISNIPASTNFTITATNTTTGCTTSQPVLAPVCGCPTVNLPSSTNKTICEGETTPSLSVTVGSGETAEWYTNATGGTVISTGLSYIPTVTAAGVYQYYVLAKNTSTGCTSSGRTPISLTILSQPIATTTSNNVSFCSGNTLTLSANGNTGDTYEWYKTLNPSLVISTNQNYIVNNATFNDVGNYVVVVTNAQGCVSANSPVVNVTLNTTPSVTISNVSQLNSCSIDDGVISINGFTLNESYSITYTKDGVSQSISSFIANSAVFNLSNLGAGNYDNFIITNSNSGCSSNIISGGPFIINNLNTEAPGFNNNAVINPTACGASDGSIVITNLTNGSIYQVIYDYNGVDFTSPNLTAANSQLLLANLASGQYSNFRITNLSSNCQSTLNSTLILNEPAPITVALVNGSIVQPVSCSNCDGSFIFDGLVSNENYEVTYTLDGVGTAEIGLQADANGAILLDQKCPGDYNNFIFKNTTNQCSTVPFTTSIVLTNPSIFTPQIDIINGLIHPTLCGQDNGGIRLSNLAANTIYSIVYTKNGIPATFGPITTTTAGDIIISNLGAGVYDVFQSTNVSTGCQSAILSGNNYILNDPTTEAATISATNGINPSTCGGTDGQITIDNLNPNTSYSISYTKNNIVQNSIILTSNSAGEINLSNLGNGQYAAFNLVNQISQCSITPNLNTALTLNDPTINFQPILTGNITICEGQSLSLSINNANTLPVGATYLWTGPNGFTSTSMQPILNQISTTQTGIYSLVVTSNGCSSNAVQTNVQVGAVPVVMINQSGGVCGENLSLNSQVTSTNTTTTYTYQWTGPNGFTSANPNILITNPTDNTHSGTYQLVVTNNSGCQAAASTVLVKIIDNITSKPLLVSNGTSFCAGETLVLTTNDFTGNNVQYTWTATNSQTTNYTTTIPTLTLTDLDEITETAVYTVQIEVNGCISDFSNATTITVNPKPANPTTLANITVCEGEQLDLTASTTGIGNYQWTGPAGFTSNQQNPLVANAATTAAAGTYTLVMEANTCISNAVQVQVAVQSKPNAAIVSNNGPICSGGTITLIVDNPIINNTIYEWFNANGQSVGFGSNLALNNATSSLSGDYYVVATINGCSFDPSATSSVPSNAFTTVEVATQEIFTAFAGEDAFICDDNYDLNASLPNTSNAFGQWTSINNAAVLIFDDQEAQTPVSNLQPGVNTFVWTLSNIGCAGLASDTVDIFYFTGPILGSDNVQTTFNTPTTFDVLKNDQLQTTDYITNIINQPTNGSLTLHGDETITYFPLSNFDGTDQFTYEVCATACSTNCATTTVSIEVVAQNEFATPTVITPNNDGLNDYFIIEGLGKYPNSTITIFNRWGDEVYRNTNYRNDWEGLYRTEMLPVGTYFYVVDVNNQNQTKLSGYVYIQRE